MLHLLAALALVCPSPAGEDLGKLYPATREWSQSGLFPVARAEDVWRVKSFEVGLGKDFELACKAATVVLGHDGTDVLWAVVLPDAPPKLSGAKAPEGERAASIVLRFAPSEVGRVFPERTVSGRGEGWLRHEAARIARPKMVWKWCTPAGNPTIVPKGVTIVDVDTVEGPRRFFALDHAKGEVARVDDFTDRATPPVKPLTPKAAAEAFDEVWRAFDREYAMFTLLPDIDWDELGKRYRKHAARVESTFALAAVLSDMLEHLEDLHVWVRCDGQHLSGYQRDRPMNGSFQACRAALKGLKEGGRELVWGRLEGDLGYVCVLGLQDKALPELFDEALEGLWDARGLVIDLRFNGGGDELLGRALAGRFLAAPAVYSRNRYRSGPERHQLGEAQDRVVEPRGPWLQTPTVCLIGRRTLSSAESLAAMFGECPNVTLLGSPTGGSSGNPRRITLDCGIEVNLPRWLDLLPDGTPLERHGVPPDVPFDVQPAAFTERADPVLDAALARLR